MSITLTVTSPKSGMWDALLKKASKPLRAKADRDLLHEASLFKADIQEGWPVAAVEGGTSRDAWAGPFKVSEGHYRILNPMPYASTIEYGGYPGVGPKTRAIGGQTLPGGIVVGPGIYPTQKPAAPVRQAMSKRKLAWAKDKFGTS